VLELAKKNAHVIVASRTPSKAQVVVDEVKAVTQNDKVEFLQLDLLSLKSVTEFLTAFKAKGLPLHLLLNNAGVMSCPYALSEDGIESQFATNHVSQVYLSLSPNRAVEPKC
jgi:NAD(P)-dependent dehydrogenase (short-subunit alcohol dehydrogenase family)